MPLLPTIWAISWSGEAAKAASRGWPGGKFISNSTGKRGGTWAERAPASPGILRAAERAALVPKAFRPFMAGAAPNAILMGSTVASTAPLIPISTRLTPGSLLRASAACPTNPSSGTCSLAASGRKASMMAPGVIGTLRNDGRSVSL